MSASLDAGRRFGIAVVAFVIALGAFPTRAFSQKNAAQTDPFGSFEQVRRQAHAYCVGYLQSGNASAYLMCLQQFAAYYCSSFSNDFFAYQWCAAAATTPYPAPGQRILTARSYRVEVSGGWEKNRDPESGVILSERPIQPSLAHTLERQPNGLYLATTYEISTGQVSGRQWVNDRCEITHSEGQPIQDWVPCLVFPDKLYLVNLVPPPDPNFPPSGRVFTPGRLADDFDEDGVVEIGYLHESGSSGREFTSGTVIAIGYDPDTRALKFLYARAIRKSDNPSTSYDVERLYRLRGQSSSP
ncbi:MAG TPA: hypothetical protein VNM72_14495 [Blastocatellia bacterium]|nr:hypothetical protein [Blastocatellia bacterium]